VYGGYPQSSTLPLSLSLSLSPFNQHSLRCQRSLCCFKCLDWGCTCPSVALHSLTQCAVPNCHSAVRYRTFPRGTYLALVPVVGGVAMATATEVNFEMIGFTCALVACLTTGTGPAHDVRWSAAGCSLILITTSYCVQQPCRACCPPFCSRVNTVWTQSTFCTTWSALTPASLASIPFPLLTAHALGPSWHAQAPLAFLVNLPFACTHTPTHLHHTCAPSMLSAHTTFSPFLNDVQTTSKPKT
jgi:hypothetical protein